MKIRKILNLSRKGYLYSLLPKSHYDTGLLVTILGDKILSGTQIY